MAQRGGSVNTHVRFGPKVFSPLIKEGEAEIFIAFEELEALRYLHFLSPAPVILVNEQRLNPASVSLGNEAYPEKIHEILSPRAKVFRRIPGRELALQAGDSRAVNLVLLGALQPLLPIAETIWTEQISRRFAPKARQINLEAFRLGRNAGIEAGR